MNVLLYLINSTQLLLLFLNGRTGSQPHDDDDDDDVLLAQVLLYRCDKARRGGQLIRKGHHSPLTHQPLCCASLVGPSIPTYLGGSTLPFYLQLSDLSRCVLFSFVAACHHCHHHPHPRRRRRVCHQPAKREREGGEEGQVVNNVDVDKSRWKYFCLECSFGHATNLELPSTRTRYITCPRL